MKNQKGFSLVELLVVVIIIAIIAAIAIPSLLASRRAANEASAVQSLRTIHSAQATHLATSATATYGTLLQLGTANLIDDQLGAAAPNDKSGYTFDEAATPTDAGYCVWAEATDQGTTGTRSFAINHDGVLNFNVADAIACAADFSITNGTVLP